MSLADAMKRMQAESDVQAGERLFYYARTIRGVTEKPPMEPGDLFRASSLYSLCPREEVLASRFEVIRTWHKEPGLQITLDIGHLFHDLYRDIYFGPMGEWVGAWRCVRCGWDTDKAGLSEPPTSHNGCTFKGKMAKMPRRCGSCHAPFVVHPDSGDRGAGTFKEWLIEDKGIGLRGHPDGWCQRMGVKRVLADLKSHGHRGFGSRKKLRDGHDLQVFGYDYMCGDEGGEVWYMNKSPWGDHPSFIRQIVVPPSKEALRSNLLTPLEELHNGLAGGAIPRRVCVSSEMPRAVGCQLCEVCFG